MMGGTESEENAMSQTPDATDVPGNEDVLNPPLEREVVPEVLERGAESASDEPAPDESDAAGESGQAEPPA
jgi:hypothetical protein